ncbi:MAG: malonyl-CoA synthase [Rhizobiaceae bacterium]
MAKKLYDALFAPHADNPKPFLVDKAGSAISYRDFIATSGRISNLLCASGVGPGDRVAVQVEKSPTALALYAACVRAGAVFLPLNTAYTPSELDYFIGNAEPALIVCDAAAETAIAKIARGAIVMTLNGDETGTLADGVEAQPAEFDTVARSGDNLAAILYTSGTTGRSKGAMLTQDNLLSNAAALVGFWRFSADDVLLHALPIYHTHGLFVATNVMLLAGGSMIFLPKFDLDAIIANLPKSTTMMGVPTFYTRLLSDPRFDRRLADHMRLFISGSAPLLAETHVEFEARTGHRILERYGMTETNMNTSNPYDGERRAGTVGFALPGVDVRICEAESGSEVTDGEIGILEVKGPNVFSGYWRMPERTAEEFRPDGYFITGDLASRDDDGYIRIAGRGKDLIISGGLNIYPKEIELLLDEQDGVLESAVIGVPHADFGEAVVGVVVAMPEALIDPGEIKAAIRDRIARFKQPREIVLVDELPRNTMGKVQKNVLRETYRDLFKD